MNTQGAFLLYVKSHPGLLGHVAAKVEQVDKLRPRFVMLHRTEPAGKAGGIAFSHRVATGKIDKNYVELYVKSWGFKIALTAAGVKAQLRRLRQQEAEQLARIDADIDFHRQRLQALSQERKVTLREAFARGHVVQVGELRAAAAAEGQLEEVVDAIDVDR